MQLTIIFLLERVVASFLKNIHYLDFGRIFFLDVYGSFMVNDSLEILASIIQDRIIHVSVYIQCNF